MTTALLMVDVQRNMLQGEQPVPSAADVTAVFGDLLDKARVAGAVVVHVQNDGPPGDPDEPDTPGWELFFDPLDGEIVVRKDQCDAFAAAGHLAETLRGRQVDRVVIAGMQSELCIEATSRGAMAEGFGVALPHGAHATYDGEQSAAEIVSGVEAALESEGVDVVGLSEVVFG